VNWTELIQEMTKRRLFVIMLVKISVFLVEQLKTADGGRRITRFYEQLDDCEFFDAVAQLKLSAL
jgi:hypothetical protein